MCYIDCPNVDIFVFHQRKEVTQVWNDMSVISLALNGDRNFICPEGELLF